MWSEKKEASERVKSFYEPRIKPTVKIAILIKERNKNLVSSASVTLQEVTKKAFRTLK